MHIPDTLRRVLIPNTVHDIGNRLLTIITLTTIIAAIAISFNGGLSGEVTLLVRNSDGTRTLERLSLSDGTVSPLDGVPSDSITTASMRVFRLSDDSIITLDKAGIVRRTASGGMSVLVASPREPRARTPLSVFGDGERIAWVSPADNSLQVFERSTRGAYLPIYTRAFSVGSLDFTDDGTTLIVSQIQSTGTIFYSIALDQGTVETISSFTGIASIVP